MINHLLLICFIIIVYEFLKFSKLKNIIKSNFKNYKELFRSFSLKDISDTKKEKLILGYAKLLFLTSIKIIFIIFCILFIAIIFDYLSKSFLNLVISFVGIVETSLFFIIYHQIRKKINAKL